MIRALKMSWRQARFVAVALLVGAASACAPVYYPSAMHVPVLRHRGDTAASGQLGFQGFQANLAHAVDDNVAVRATVHSTLASGDSYYHLFSAGAGAFWAEDAEPEGETAFTGAGLFAAASLEAGVAFGSGELTYPSETGSEPATFVNSGTVLRIAGQLDAGYESRAAMVGLSARTVAIQVHHDQAITEGTTRSSGVFLEPVALLRLGPPALYVEGQAGIWLPMAMEGDVGIPWPLIFSFGVGGRM